MKLLQKIKFYNSFRNPLYHWWKARKVFNFPKVHIICGKDVFFFGMYCRKDYYNKFVTFVSKGLGYKTKYDEYRYEYDPFIEICLFRKFHFVIKFDYLCADDKYTATKNAATWEAILDYIDGLTIEECIKKHAWQTIGDNKEIITINSNIKKKYRIEVK